MWSTAVKKHSDWRLYVFFVVKIRVGPKSKKLLHVIGWNLHARIQYESRMTVLFLSVYRVVSGFIRLKMGLTDKVTKLLKANLHRREVVVTTCWQPGGSQALCTPRMETVLFPEGLIDGAEWCLGGVYKVEDHLCGRGKPQLKAFCWFRRVFSSVL